MKKVLFPGSFDPITKGHMHIISQASDIFDEVYIGVLQNLSKSSFFFTIEERLEMIKQLYENDDRIKVVSISFEDFEIRLILNVKKISQKSTKILVRIKSTLSAYSQILHYLVFPLVL